MKLNPVRLLESLRDKDADSLIDTRRWAGNIAYGSVGVTHFATEDIAMMRALQRPGDVEHGAAGHAHGAGQVDLLLGTIAHNHHLLQRLDRRHQRYVQVSLSIHGHFLCFISDKGKDQSHIFIGY